MGRKARIGALASLVVLAGFGAWRVRTRPSAALRSGEKVLAEGLAVRFRLHGEVGAGAKEAVRDAMPGTIDDLLAAAWDPAARAAWTAGAGPAVRVTFEDDSAVRAFVRERARRGCRAGRPVVLLGWDGADPRVIEDLLRAGHLRNLAALRARGAFGRLRSHAPYLSPLLWTSVATGKRPFEHGVLDFVERDGTGGSRPVSAACRRSVPIWELASDLGRKVLVINWWASDPPASIAGEVVSDRMVRGGGALAGGRVGPGDPEVAAVLARLGIDAKDPAERVRRLGEFAAETLTMQRVLLDRMRRGTYDLVLAYSGLPDQAAHLFVREMPPRQGGVAEKDYRSYGGVVHGTYLLLDTLLGEVVEAAPAGAAIVLISDHGFVYGRERGRIEATEDPLSDALHSPEGIYVVAGAGQERTHGADLDLYDVAPTLLELLGIPPADDMAGKPAAGIARENAPPAVPTHEVDLDPPPLALVEGTPCGDLAHPETAEERAASREAIERLRALGYVAGAGSAEEPPVLPLANLGRALLDAGQQDRAVAALERAVRLRPHDPRLGFLYLEALVRAGDSRRAEEVARTYFAAAGEQRPEFAFILAEILLVSGRTDEALSIAAAVAEKGTDGALTALLAAAWTGDRRAAESHALRAAALDPVRAIDTVQAFAEVFADRDLGIDSLVDAMAAVVPIQEVLRAPVTMGGGPVEATMRRARKAAAGPSRTPGDLLWLRRASRFDPDIRIEGIR